MRREKLSEKAETRVLTIQGVGAQGDGLGLDNGDRRAFVPLTLAGERVTAEVTGERGELTTVLDASSERVAPPCPHFGACGGCAFQHWNYPDQLVWKSEQVRQILAREGLETNIAPVAPARPHSRRRVALHARPGSRGEAKLGFKGRRSWSLVDIHACEIADPKIVAALPGLKRLAAALLEHPKSAPTLHVTVTLSGLDIEVTGVEQKSGGLSVNGRMDAAEAAQALDLARLTMNGEPIYVPRRPVIRLGQALVEPPPGAFLQATPEAEAAMVGAVLDAAEGVKKAADLFCGLGTFALPLAEHIPVLAADSAAASVRAMKAAGDATPGLKPIQTLTRDLFRDPVSSGELKGCDLIVFDPPRAGGLAQAQQIACSDASTVIGVSCAPTTFARDARVLVDAGWSLERVTPVDQFLWSSHIELIGLFRR